MSRAETTVEFSTGDRTTGPIPLDQFNEAVDRMTGEIHENPQQGVLPTFEGLVIDNYVVAFGGRVVLGEFETEQEVRDTLRLGRRVRLVVEGVVVAVPHSFKPAKTLKDEDEVTRGARVVVDTVSLE